MTRLAGSSKLLRAMNESAALGHLLDRGELTRNQLRDLTGLSKPTVSEALRRLTDAGLARVVGHVSAGPGPNAAVYAANHEAAYAVAVSVRDIPSAELPADLPAMTAVACDVAGTVRGRVDSAVDFLYTDPVDAVEAIVTDLCRTTGIDPQRLTHIQIGVPGAYDPRTDAIHHIDVPGWSRPGLVTAIRARLRTDVDVDNDVNLAAIAERGRGVARDVDGFALLWLGEGLGLAIDLGGTLLRGSSGGAGEIGYMPLYVPGSRADRQRTKADLQDLVGGPAVLALAGEHGGSARTPAEAVANAVAVARGSGAGVAWTEERRERSDRSDEGRRRLLGPRGPRERSERIKHGTGSTADAARAFLAELADRIAVGLAAVVAVLDPPLVVLAGDVAQAGGDALREAVTAAMEHAAPLSTTVAVTAIDDDAVLLGGLDAGLVAVREALISSVKGQV